MYKRSASKMAIASTMSQVWKKKETKSEWIAVVRRVSMVIICSICSRLVVCLWIHICHSLHTSSFQSSKEADRQASWYRSVLWGFGSVFTSVFWFQIHSSAARTAIIYDQSTKQSGTSVPFFPLVDLLCYRSQCVCCFFHLFVRLPWDQLHDVVFIRIHIA